MPDVRLPNGDIARFPDNMSAAQIEAVLRRQFPSGPQVAHGNNPFAGASASGDAPRQSGVQAATGFLANVNRGIGIGDEIVASERMVLDAVQGRRPSFSRAMAAQRATEDSVDPRLAALGRGTGMAATAAVPVGGAANVARTGSIVGNALRGAVTGGTAAAVYSAADAGTPAERLGAAAAAARDPAVLTLGAVGGAVLGPRARRAPRGADPNLRALRQRGVRVTPGQAMGGAARANEDAAMSVPILGDEIRARRTEGIQDFDRGVLNDAHQAAFGRPLPTNVQAGREGVRRVGDAISNAYERTVPTGGVVADGEFANAVRGLGPEIELLTPAAQAQLRNILEQRVTARFRNRENPSGAPLLTQGGSTGSGPRMDGRTYQRVQSELRTLIARFGGSTDADQRAMGEVLQGVSSGLEDAARRQNPQFAETMDRLDHGWALVTRAEDAAQGGSAASGGVFTPNQYSAAIRRGDPRVRHRGFARGEALGQEYAEAGSAVLPPTIPDSGTGRRTMLGDMVSGGATSAVGAVTGGAAGGAQGAVLGAVAAPVARALVLKAASLGYSRPVIALTNRILDSSIAQADRQAALFRLQSMARQDPRLQAHVAEVVERVTGMASQTGALTYQRQDENN